MPVGSFPKTDMPYGSVSVFVSPSTTALCLWIRQLSSKSILKYVVYAFTCHMLVCLECVVGGIE